MCGDVAGSGVHQCQDRALMQPMLVRLRGGRARLEGLLLADLSALCRDPIVTGITRGPSARRMLTTSHPPGLWPFARLVF